MGIKSFKVGNIAEEIWYFSVGGKVPKNISKQFSSEPGLIKKAIKILQTVDNIDSDPLRELHLTTPGSNPHKITVGDYAGCYSIWIDRKWRVCFLWGSEHGLDSDAYDVEITKHYGDKNS